MCMVRDKGWTKRFRQKMKAAGGTITCWKTYNASKGVLCSPLFRSRLGGKARPGLVVSTRMGRAPGEDSTDTPRSIRRGIHVFRSRHSAKCYGWTRLMVPVRCRLADFVCAGTWGEAVFTKVRLLKKDFDAAMQENPNA